MKLEKPIAPSGIILYAKKPGHTSFSSLNLIKKALNTKKLGHTGTLDSFAEGLLIVVVGSLTRLGSHITAFDKTYEAIFAFGAETDTLDPLGTIIKTAPLPDYKALEAALQFFTGDLMQIPPSYSAVHINGKRASDLVRSGKKPEISPRPVRVYKAELLETRQNIFNQGISHARILFSVSKGTYIRSLARDIGYFCGSAAYLAGLRRTRVGTFFLEQAAGFSELKLFTIDAILKNNEGQPQGVKDDVLQNHIRDALMPLNPSLAAQCGLKPIELKDSEHFAFFNASPLSASMFVQGQEKISAAEPLQDFAVFTKSGHFAGVIMAQCDQTVFKALSYGFVIHPPCFYPFT